MSNLSILFKYFACVALKKHLHYGPCLLNNILCGCFLILSASHSTRRSYLQNRNNSLFTSWYDEIDSVCVYLCILFTCPKLGCMTVAGTTGLDLGYLRSVFIWIQCDCNFGKICICVVCGTKVYKCFFKWVQLYSTWFFIYVLQIFPCEHFAILVFLSSSV